MVVGVVTQLVGPINNPPGVLSTAAEHSPQSLILGSGAVHGEKIFDRGLRRLPTRCRVRLVPNKPAPGPRIADQPPAIAIGATIDVGGRDRHDRLLLASHPKLRSVTSCSRRTGVACEPLVACRDLKQGLVRQGVLHPLGDVAGFPWREQTTRRVSWDQPWPGRSPARRQSPIPSWHHPTVTVVSVIMPMGSERREGRQAHVTYSVSADRAIMRCSLSDQGRRM